jgi:hypothetical protein
LSLSLPFAVATPAPRPRGVFHPPGASESRLAASGARPSPPRASLVTALHGAEKNHKIPKSPLTPRRSRTCRNLALPSPHRPPSFLERHLVTGGDSHTLLRRDHRSRPRGLRGPEVDRSLRAGLRPRPAVALPWGGSFRMLPACPTASWVAQSPGGDDSSIVRAPAAQQGAQCLVSGKTGAPRGFRSGSTTASRRSIPWSPADGACSSGD